MKSVECIRDICNSNYPFIWNITIHLQVANGLSYSHPLYTHLQSVAYCSRTQSYIPIILESFDAKIGFGLNRKHRLYLLEHLDEFDYVSYAEEDMLLTLSLLTAYLKEMEILQFALPLSYQQYFIGFIRYEEDVVGYERVTWEYFPQQINVVNMGETLGNYIVTNNLNQAIYIMSREQLLLLEERCEFLSQPGQNGFYKELRRAQNQDWKFMSVGVSEWSSSFQQVLQCGMRRIIPVNLFPLFMIHHSTNIAQKRRRRKEHLTMSNWSNIVASKSLTPISIDEAYNIIIYQQYNLHLIERKRFESTAKWSYTW